MIFLKIWLGLGATPSLVATTADADEDKENSIKNYEDGNNTFPMTQDLHLELFDTETQEIVPRFGFNVNPVLSSEVTVAILIITVLLASLIGSISVRFCEERIF